MPKTTEKELKTPNISRFSAPFEVSYQYLFFLLRMYLYNTRNQVVAQAARGFESHPVRQLQGFCYEQKPCFFMSSLKKFPHGHPARLTAPDNADNDDIGSRYFGRNVAISHGIDGFAFKKRSCVRTHQKNRIVYSNTLCRKADP